MIKTVKQTASPDIYAVHHIPGAVGEGRHYRRRDLREADA